jgi:hypothetical protein
MFELPRASEFWLKRWNPPFEPVRALLFPGRATSRPFVHLPAGWFVFEICDPPRPNERDGTEVLPRAE